MNTWYLYAYLSWSRSDGRARKHDPDPRVQETRSQTLGIIPFCPQALNPKTFWLTVSIKQHYSLCIARRSDPKLRKVTPKTKLEPSVIQDLQRADKSASVENTGIAQQRFSTITDVFGLITLRADSIIWFLAEIQLNFQPSWPHFTL